jgi:hypothetical protein
MKRVSFILLIVFVFLFIHSEIYVHSAHDDFISPHHFSRLVEAALTRNISSPLPSISHLPVDELTISYKSILETHNQLSIFYYDFDYQLFEPPSIYLLNQTFLI